MVEVMNTTGKRLTMAMAGGIALAAPVPVTAQSTVPPAEARAIAKEAYVYSNPIVDSYRIMHTWFVDRDNPGFKAPWNRMAHEARVYTPDDTTVQTANSDTPYSYVGLDLRGEPIVLSVPEIDEGRYFSIQLIDLYTHNFAYIGSRTTGNGGGHFLIAGPGWKGEVPGKLTKVIRSETEFAVALYRTQLFGADDLDDVRAIQAGYKARPLSAFLGEPAPVDPPVIAFPEPLTRDEIRTSPKVFDQVNFILQFCPRHPSEHELMERFTKIGIGAGKVFEPERMSPEVQQAIGEGIKDAWASFEELRQAGERGEVTSADVFGTREELKNNYLHRMGGAVMGIWGNSQAEAIYPSYSTDSDGKPLDGSHHYTLRFPKGQLPPVHAFWSLTMYGMPASLLVHNPLDRYLLNSTMLDRFVRDSDGGITLHFQHESPGTAREANWLPAPKGPFMVTMRLYWPRTEALDGSWKQPALRRVRPED